MQTFLWRLLRRALPTGLRASRFSVHISKNCCRCGHQEDESHLFFLCPFARAAWFDYPWFIRSDVLIQGHTSMHSILIALLQMGHPNGSISNILNFLWCLWKARNDFLFDRKKALPHHVHIAAMALSSDSYNDLPHFSKMQVMPQVLSPPDHLPTQGRTLKSDLLITGTKIFSDAAFRSSKVPGLLHGAVATGIGVYLVLPQDRFEINVQIQASAPPTTSPLHAEALALSFAAQVASKLNILQPTFLMDCLSLSLVAATGKIVESTTPWSIRKPLADFFKHANSLQPRVFHISREINGIAHNVAHQVLHSRVEPQVCCFASAHRHSSCPVLSLLSSFQVQEFVIHAVHCY